MYCEVGWAVPSQPSGASRPKHPRRDLEFLLREAERQGWRISGGGNKYFKIKCPCAEKHLKIVHLIPSENYSKNLRRWLARRTCWEGEQ